MNNSDRGQPELIGLIDISISEQHRRMFSRAKFLELYELAMVSANERIELLVAAQDELNFDEILSHAHALSGLSRNFGFIGLHKSIDDVEICAREKDEEHIFGSIRELKRMRRITFEKFREIVPYK